MQFTPQQLSGGPKFSSTTRIGNWQEEVALEEAKLADFRKRSKGGNLAIRRLENKMEICTVKVNHTYSEDGSIRYGDNIMLQHDGSGHFLACDPYEDFMPGAYKYYVSCASSPTAVARNTFRVVRPPRGLESLDADPDDDVLRIGQGFSLMCNEKLLIQPDSKLLSPPLYLSSAKKNERNATKTTNRQLVYLSPSHDADAVWFVNKPSQGRANASDRFLSNGDAVNAQETLLLTHRQTNCCLVCDTKQRDHTDFGVELECYADRTNAFGKLGLVVSEFKGVSTAYTLSKPDAPHYFWHIVTASAPQAVPESTFGERGDLSIPTDRDILREFQALVRAKGVDAYWSLRHFFFSGDSGFDNKIDRGDLKDGLLIWGIAMDHRYIDRIIDVVDTRKTDGIIDFQKFMDYIRGEIPISRVNIINSVWNDLDSNHTGAVPIEEMSRIFRVDEHPMYTLGNVSRAEILKQFLLLCRTKGGALGSNINIKAKTPVVTKQCFVSYYEDLSAGISDADEADNENNAYFEKIIVGNWL